MNVYTAASLSEFWPNMERRDPLKVLYLLNRVWVTETQYSVLSTFVYV